MLDFSNNINFIGPPAGYDAQYNPKTLLEYPDHEQQLPRQIIAAKYKIKPENIALTVGATEALSITANLATGCASGLCPSFWEYEHFYVQHHGKDSYKKIHLSPKNNFQFCFDAFDQLAKDQLISTFYLANPNNPTTTLLSKNALLGLIYKYPNILFVLDETYLMFSSTYWETTLTKEATNLPNLIVITSMSKIFSLPGLRLGFSISNASYMEKFRKLVIPYGVSKLSQIYASWLINQDDFLSNTRAQYAKQSTEFYKLIQSQLPHTTKVYKSSAPYFLIKINDDKVKSNNLLDFLTANEVIVRGGNEFELLDNSWLRVSVKDICSNTELVKRISEFLRKN